MKLRRQLLTLLLCLSILLGLSPLALAADASVVEQAIVALGIMQGDETGNLNLSANVTRAQFARMLVAASTYRDTIQEGSGSSPFKDVKYTHWAADTVNTVVVAGWMTGYLDGTFRPDQTISYEEGCSAILKMLGYSSADLTGTYPQAHIAKFTSLKLAVDIAPVQGRALTRQECMHIFYNLMGADTKEGAVYGTTLGYALDEQGGLDYDALIQADLEGPLVVDESGLTALLPFDVDQARVYRNSKASTAAAVRQYDVVYYHPGVRTVWVYSDRAIGMLTAVDPNTVSPASATVAGNTYALGTSTVKSKLSATGLFAVGDTVALLLGMNGDAVDVVSADLLDGVYYGVVVSTAHTTTALDHLTSTADYTITVACTDGVTRQAVVPRDRDELGNVVLLRYTKGQLSVERQENSTLRGTVNTDATKLGDVPLASDIEIMDVSQNGEWTVLYPSRIVGVSLDTDDIVCAATNAQGELSHLILRDVTGDMIRYGVLTSVRETENPGSAPPAGGSGGSVGSLSGTYGYLLEGVAGTMQTNNKLFELAVGPAMFRYKDGQMDDIKGLTRISIDDLSPLSARSGQRVLRLAQEVQVYIKADGQQYHLTDLTAVNPQEYTLSGYYETGYPAGGQIRVVIAEKK